MDFLLQAQDQLIPAHSKYIFRIISLHIHTVELETGTAF